MPNSELKNYVKSMLGDDYVEVELTDETLNIIIKQVLDKIAPFYDGRRYILGERIKTKIINKNTGECFFE